MTPFTRAVLRRPAATFADGITTADLGRPDFELACTQHENYIRALADAGLQIVLMEADPRFPDSVFIEDTAVLTRDFALITRPGAVSRRGEIHEVESILHRYFKRIEHINSPGLLDGGDVLQVEKTFYVGLSDRTSRDGFDQFARIVGSYNYKAVPVEVEKMLHLKSGVAWLGEDNLLICDALAREKAFAGFNKITIPPEESYAANAIMVNGRVLVARGFPITAARLEKAGFDFLEMDVSEFRKMDGGLSCLSLRL